jgi:prepilin-type processing-associated H-X9-DG protein
MLNAWIYDPATIANYENHNPGLPGMFNKQSNIRHPAQTVMFGDSIWEDGWPNGGTQGTPGDSLSPAANLFLGSTAAQPGNGIMMGRVCIARHGINPAKAPSSAPTSAMFPGGINVAQADGHVEYTKLDALWSTYYWHALSVPQTRPGLP